MSWKSKMQDDPEICYFCKSKTPYLEKHHALNGPDRNKAEEDGLYVSICNAFGPCQAHHIIHNQAAGTAIRMALKREAQRIYEKTHTREEFIRRYGKNYL